MPRPRFLLPLLAALGIGGALAPAAPVATVPDPKWLEWNPQTRTVKYALIAGLTGSSRGPFNFNGYVDGGLTLTVPESSTVVLNFVNQDGTPHSAMVIADTTPMPSMADTPAIPRAYTTKAGEGLGYFEKDVIRFKAAPSGRYRIFCGVPGHGLSGMWIRLRVSSEATLPSQDETGTGS